MVEKLKKGEKSKRMESEPSHPAQKGKLAKETRERVKGWEKLEKFEKSRIGKDMLKVFEAKGIAEVFENEGLLTMAICRSGMPRPGESEDAFTFLMVASKKSPDLVREYLRVPDFDQELRNLLIAEMGWDPLELTVEADRPAQPRPVSEKREGVDNATLVKELVETEAYGAVVDQIDADEIIDSLKHSHKSIDWDDVVSNMPEYSVKAVMDYLKKRKINIDRPKPSSLEAIVSDLAKLEKAFDKLGNIYGDVDPRHFGAFALMVAEKNPKFVFDYYSKYPFAQVRDIDSKKALVKWLVGKGYPAKESLFEEPPAE